jgi:hypothetical protein
VANHAVADVATSEAFGLGAAEDAKDVVLRAGQVVSFQELFGLLGQGVGDLLEGDEYLGLQENGRTCGTLP